MFLFTNKQLEIKSMIEVFVKKRIETDALKRNNEKIYPEEIIKELGELGYCSMIIPEEYDGINIDTISNMIVINEISKSDASIGHILSTINYGFCNPIKLFGSHEQKEKYLKNFTKSNNIGALAYNEPDGISLGQIKTIARKENDCYILNGTKSMISNANMADYAIVFAKTDKNPIGLEGYSFFIVKLKNNISISIGKVEQTMGLESLNISEIHFEDVQLPESCLLGEVGKGMFIIIKSMELMRLANAAVALGIAERAFKEVSRYVTFRKVNNMPLIKLQTVQHALVDMKSLLDLMHLATFYGAYVYDKNLKDLNMQQSIIKGFVTEKAKEICDQALQLFGGYGYIKDSIIEKLYRDVRAMTIMGGSNEMLKSIIAFEMFGVEECDF